MRLILGILITLLPAVVHASAIGGGAINSNDAVGTAKILTAAITTEKLATDAVTSPKILTAAVETSKLATDAVTTTKVLTAAITTGKLATDAVTAAKIISGAVETSKIAADAVTSDKIAQNPSLRGTLAVAGDVTLNGGASALCVNESDAGNCGVNLEANTARGLIELKTGGVTKVQQTGGTEDNYFNGGGNFGINTGAPKAKLDVNGDSAFRGAVTVVSSVTVSDSSGIKVDGPVYVNNAGSLSAPAVVVDYSNSGLYTLEDATNPRLHIVNRGIESIVIRKAGSTNNVGINTTTPCSTCTLQVNGTIVSRGSTDGSEVGAGEVGEIISSAGSSRTPISNVGVSFATITLTAGTWDIEAYGAYTPGTSNTQVIMAISSINDDFNAANLSGRYQHSQAYTASATEYFPIGRRRVVLTSETEYYLSCLVTWTGTAGTCSSSSLIWAERIR